MVFLVFFFCLFSFDEFCRFSVNCNKFCWPKSWEGWWSDTSTMATLMGEWDSFECIIVLYGTISVSLEEVTTSCPIDLHVLLTPFLCQFWNSLRLQRSFGLTSSWPFGQRADCQISSIRQSFIHSFKQCTLCLKVNISNLLAVKLL